MPDLQVSVPIPRPVPNKTDRTRPHHASKLFPILSVPIMNSFHKQFIKYDICGVGAPGMICIKYSNFSSLQ